MSQLPTSDSGSNKSQRRILILTSSPRTDGNSAQLAHAFAKGARESGSEVEISHLSGLVKFGLQDCRKCRDADGHCTIRDDFEGLFLNKALVADAWVYATPIWWYGISGHLKNFLDRIFCYISESNLDSENVMEKLMGKHVALLLSAEESNFSARLAIIQQIQETCRYLHHTMVGIVVGIGNKRGEVQTDPNVPLDTAADLGRRLFDIEVSDYKLDTVRSDAVWGADKFKFPARWY